MNLKSFILIHIVVVSIAFGAVDNITLDQVLSNSYEQGEITQVEMVQQQLNAIYKPDLLPKDLLELNSSFSRNATHLKFKAFELYHTPGTLQKEILEPFLSRASFSNLTESYISNSGLFKLHYTTSGEDAATMDFIIKAAEAFDNSYDFEINVLGYMPPPIDDPQDPQYDVYIYNFGDYGATTPENSVPDTKRDDYTSYIEMDNDFQHTPTQGVDAINVTAAHEFFHMIHLGYRGYFNTEIDAIFLFESTATWMEDMVYDDVNDYYYYVPSLFQNLDNPFYSTGYSHEYGLAVFHHMLEKKYGRDIVKLIWEYFIDNEVFDAINNALLDHGSNFKMEIADFSIWNYFTGNRSNPELYYPEGEFYPQIRFTQEKQIQTNVTLDDQVELQSTNYYKITAKSSGSYSITPEFPESEQWIYSVILQSVEDEYETMITGGNSPKNLQAGSLSDIIICPIYSRFPDKYSMNNKPKSFTMDINRGSVETSQNKMVSIKPNPFILEKHGKVDIVFTLAEQSDNVFISIYNEAGQRINRIELERCPDGTNLFQWDGTSESGEGVVSGVYLIVIEGKEIIGPAKIALIR